MYSVNSELGQSRWLTPTIRNVTFLIFRNAAGFTDCVMVLVNVGKLSILITFSFWYYNTNYFTLSLKPFTILPAYLCVVETPKSIVTNLIMNLNFLDFMGDFSFLYGPTPASISFLFGPFRQTIQFVQQINVKSIHPVYGAGIRTHDLSNITHGGLTALTSNICINQCDQIWKFIGLWATF